MNIPNYITYFRIILIPFLILIFYIPEPQLSEFNRNLIALLIFITAGISDWLDGYLARKLKLESKFGAFIDPVADKLIVMVALIILVDLSRINVIVASIIIGREIAISALREWMAQIGSAKNVAVAFIGKLKTTLQFIAISLLLFYTNVLFIPVIFLGQLAMGIAVSLTIISMIYYLKQAFNSEN
ncbi:MAG: CDP-diacylglycerol--glycerol-3-phosphate 3-phosphatidyltransferase [Nitrosomonadales bacterium]|jgi:CDP-diacylglycerol--glycerol-3-phosphate 3-phosphatidyltransferase